MSPKRLWQRRGRGSFPRQRGDEPTYGERTAYEQMFSPPARG